MPDPIVKPAGATKNACERNAATRFRTKFRQDSPALKVMVTEDRRSANAPHIERLQDHGVHYLLGVKEGDHALLFQQVAQAEHAGRVTSYDRDNANQAVHHRFRFVSAMPLNASNAALRVNFLECGETPKGTVQHCSWVTDRRLNTGTVYRLMQGARARWRLENETCNTLKNQGDHFEHTFGHGSQHLSVVVAVLMMRAFCVDQVQQLCCPLLQAAWGKWGSKRLRWEKRRALFYTYALDAMERLLHARYSGVKTSAPLLDIDSSSSTTLPPQTIAIRRSKLSSVDALGGAVSQWRPDAVALRVGHPCSCEWGCKIDR
jgi:hypothetical protein